jgi:hypothetical protein
MRRANELRVPPGAAHDPNARECLRLWAVGSAMEVSLLPQVWPEPAYWGLALADLVRHLALAYQQTEDRDPDETASQVVGMLMAELQSPTDEPTGKMVEQ